MMSDREKLFIIMEKSIRIAFEKPKEDRMLAFRKSVTIIEELRRTMYFSIKPYELEQMFDDYESYRDESVGYLQLALAKLKESKK